MPATLGPPAGPRGIPESWHVRTRRSRSVGSPAWTADVRSAAEDKIGAARRRGVCDVVVVLAGVQRRSLADAVPHYMAPCWYTLDPASLLITSHYQEGLPEFPPEWAAAGVRRTTTSTTSPTSRASPSGISTLHEATDGDPSSSPRWHANMAYGGDQEMVAALRTRGGEAWGSLGLYREPDRPLFDARRAGVRPGASRRSLADGVRRGCWSGEASRPRGTRARRA